MNLNEDQDQDTRLPTIHKPETFVLEKNSALQIKLVLWSVVIVAVVWIGVLVALGMEVVRRLNG